MATLNKTFSFASSQESWTWTNTSGAVTSAARNAADQALEVRESHTEQTSAAGYWEWTGSWEDLGIPAGATVTAIDGDYKWRCTLATNIDPLGTSKTGAFTFRNSSGTLQGTFSSAQSFTGTTSFATINGANLAVPAGMQASNTTIRLRLEATLASDAVFDAVDIKLQHDDIALVITYTEPAGGQPGSARHSLMSPRGRKGTLGFNIGRAISQLRRAA